MAVEQTVIEGLLVVFYVYILLVIITSKEKILKNAFYSIFIATGIADVTALISGCTLRLTNEASSKEGVEGIMRCCCILSGISACAHLIGNLFITINRYSALCLPYKYDSIWTRRNLLAAVVVQYTVSFAAFAHLFTAEFVYIYNEDGTIAYIILEESASTTVTVTYCISYATYAILCFGFNSRAFFAWRRLSKTDGWSKHRHHDKVGRFTFVRCSGIHRLDVDVHPRSRLRYRGGNGCGRIDAVAVNTVLLVDRPYGEYTANFSAVALFRPTTESYRPF
ncbi:hypothetical protein V3C99_007094 [Haemonchus contortus]